MRHKYIIRITDDLKDLLISEQAEVDKDMFSALCEEKFPLESIREALAGGEAALVDTLRSVNFYPPLEYASQLAVVVQEMLSDGTPERRELLIDDRQIIEADEAAMVALAAEEALPPEVEDLDDLLDDDASADITGMEDDDDGDKENN